MAAIRSESAESDQILSTKEKILSQSTRLFNEHGVQRVAVHRIAAELGISPGNVAYHFKNKRAIIAAIFPLIESEMIESLRPPPPPITPAGGADFQIRIFRTLWKYRFFFNGLLSILSKDPTLAPAYKRFQNQIIATLQGVLDTLVKQHRIPPVAPPNTTRLIAMNMWMLWLGWLRLQGIVNLKRNSVENNIIYEGAMLHFSLMERFYSKNFANGLVTELARKLTT